MGNVENVRMVKEALTEAINEVCKEKEKYSTFLIRRLQVFVQKNLKVTDSLLVTEQM